MSHNCPAAREILHLPPLDPTNAEEATLLARCVDPGVRDQQVSEEPMPKKGRPPRELVAPVPKRARTLPKPRARVIPVEKTKQPLSEEEIIHNIYNPVSAPFSKQEGEEEFTLGEPEIPMRPSAMVEETPSTTGEEPAIDHAAVEPEAIVLEEPREMPETTLPEVLADIEQLVTQAVIEETEVERRDQNSAEPPSVMKTSQGKAKVVSEAGCSRGKQAETSTQEQAMEEIPKVPKGTGAEEEIDNFRIGSYDPMLNPNSQTFEYILDVAEDEEHIDRGLYHAERAVAYFKAVDEASRKKTEYIHNISLMHAKADRLQKELEREREDRKLQEAEDASMIRTLHLRTKELVAEKEDMKKKLSAAKTELKGVQQQLTTAQSKMTDWSNLANRHEEALKTLSEEHDTIKEQLIVAVEQRKDADLQLIQIIEQQKKAAKDLEDAREENKQLSEELVQARKSLANKKALDEKLEQTTRRMSELEEAMQQMKKSDDDLDEALKRISLLEKAANPVVKALVPEDPASPQSFLERLKAMPRQLKAYIKRSSKACLVHVLAVIRSRYPEVDIGKLVEGAEPNCTEAAFRDLKQEAEPVAEAIVQSLRL
nr:unnamed protein product [Digitaria exilis]